MKRLLPLLMLLLFAAGCTKHPPVGKVLVYEVDSGSESDADTQPVDEEVVVKMVAVLNRRVNPGWTRRARIRPLGEGQIEIAIYGNDPEMAERIERLVESVGTLEFRILANRRDHAALIERAEQDEGKKLRDDGGRLLAWWVPVADGQEETFSKDAEIAVRQTERNGRPSMEVLVVKDAFDVNGSYLAGVTPNVDEMAQPCLNFRLNYKGGQLFAGLTGANLPDRVTGFSRRLGIILGGYLHSAPGIKSTIRERGQITGSFTEQEVEDLANILAAGSLPAKLRKVEPAPARDDAGSSEE